MKAIIVTGGAGFIGSNYIKHLLQLNNDYLVINYDKLTYAGNLDNVKELKKHPMYRFIKGDIGSQKHFSKIIKEYDPDFVVNFAAESHVDRSINDPFVFGRTNVMGTLNILECLKKHWQQIDYQNKRFLQVSTDEVYGSIENKEDSFTEDCKLMPNSPYSASKAGADLMVRAYIRTYGFPAMITRCCNNYGSHQNYEKFIPSCIRKALNNETIPIYGDGTNIREWIHVNDHCAAITKVLLDGDLGEVYNIGSGEEVSNIEMAKLILKYLGKESDAIERIADRPGHDWRYALDSSKIKNQLGWKCIYQLDNGIRDTIRWYMAQAKPFV
jgi:dTDP-glucose 4,6-dehydratase